MDRFVCMRALKVLLMRQLTLNHGIKNKQLKRIFHIGQATV